MGNFFVNKFQDKSSEELQEIINNKGRYQTDAVNAAIQILNERENTEIPNIQPSKPLRLKQGSDDQDLLAASFSFKPFFGRLSYRDFLTSICLALSLLAIMEILGYYSTEKLIEDIFIFLSILIMLIFLSLNHVIYRAEHKKSNNYVGRVIHDIIFMIFFIPFNLVYHYLITGYSGTFVEGNVLAILLVAILLLMFFELFIALLKRLLNLIGWRIF